MRGCQSDRVAARVAPARVAPARVAPARVVPGRAPPPGLPPPLEGSCYLRTTDNCTYNPTYNTSKGIFGGYPNDK